MLLVRLACGRCVHAAANGEVGVEENKSNGKKEDGEDDDDDEEEACGICREPVEDLVRAECGCAFCR